MSAPNYEANAGNQINASIYYAALSQNPTIQGDLTVTGNVFAADAVVAGVGSGSGLQIGSGTSTFSAPAMFVASATATGATTVITSGGPPSGTNTSQLYLGASSQQNANFILGNTSTVVGVPLALAAGVSIKGQYNGTSAITALNDNNQIAIANPAGIVPGLYAVVVNTSPGQESCAVSALAYFDGTLWSAGGANASHSGSAGPTGFSFWLQPSDTAGVVGQTLNFGNNAGVNMTGPITATFIQLTGAIPGL